MSNRFVLDASAILVLLNQEPGTEAVRDALRDGAVVAAVNLSEVVAKMSEAGLSPAETRRVIETLGLDVRDFDREQAYEAGFLRLETKKAGLSLGDRACIALAKTLGLVALTADRSWVDLGASAEIKVVR